MPKQSPPLTAVTPDPKPAAVPPQPIVMPKSVSEAAASKKVTKRTKELLLTNKELSWLSFNERVLQEAADSSVPLMDRVRFLGIFSSNMDEFFRVRVAGLQRQIRAGKKLTVHEGHDLKKVFKKVQETVVALYARFDDTYEGIRKELVSERINFVDETALDEGQAEFVKGYFHRHVRPRVTPIMLDQIKKTLPVLRDDATYLVVCMRKKPEAAKSSHALIEVPADVVPRFLELPPRGMQRYVIFLDDVIRYCLEYIFGVFHYYHFESYAIKVTRDSELDFDDDLWSSYLKRVSRGLEHRKRGHFVRFLHDEEMPQTLLDHLTKKLKLKKDALVMAGGRYHNLRDLMQFPELGLSSDQYEPMPPLFHSKINRRKRLTETIRKRDILIHYPYQTFQYVLDFLRDASVDPRVTSIKFTIYRVARLSSVVNALINAARNGKKVTVILELQARFDEENNIFWGNRLQEEGVRVMYGMEGLKFHSKLCLVTRTEKQRAVSYALIGTGNWHEETVRLYSDHCLFTADKRLTQEVDKVFEFCEKPFKTPKFRNLVVAPFTLRKTIMSLIRREVRNAKAGQPAYIVLKLNNLADTDIVKALYRASQAGVKIKLLVRSMFSLVPGVPGVSENIEAKGIVDRYLEHSRIFVFCNAGEPEYYISSADLMMRNLDRRVEVACPIYDPALRHELQEFLDIQWADNTKARTLDADLTNQVRATPDNPPVRAQWEIYAHLKKRALKE